MFDARREDAPGFNAHRAEPPKIRLAHGAQPLVRDGGSVQFGLDATRTGIVAVERPTALASTLVTFHRPVELPEALRRLEAAGLSRAAAEVLVSDLMACGVLRVHRCATARVLLLGRSPSQACWHPTESKSAGRWPERLTSPTSSTPPPAARR